MRGEKGKDFMDAMSCLDQGRERKKNSIVIMYGNGRKAAGEKEKYFLDEVRSVRRVHSTITRVRQVKQISYTPFLAWAR